MITITKDTKITIDKGDVSVLSDVCEMARRYLADPAYSMEFRPERREEIRKFLRIIFEGV